MYTTKIFQSFIQQKSFSPSLHLAYIRLLSVRFFFILSCFKWNVNSEFYIIARVYIQKGIAKKIHFEIVHRNLHNQVLKGSNKKIKKGRAHWKQFTRKKSSLWFNGISWNLLLICAENCTFSWDLRNISSHCSVQMKKKTPFELQKNVPNRDRKRKKNSS